MSRAAVAWIAAAVVIAVLTATTAVGLLHGRPLPTVDGHYRFLGLHERAEVVRDAFGIPRIYAADAHDLFFLQGYVTAQDRFAQMEAMRMEARSRPPSSGTSVAGRLGEALDAYAAGVTKYIEQHREHRALPAETVLSGRSPARWSAADSLAIAATYLAAAMDSATCVAVAGAKALRGRPLLAAELNGPVPVPGWYEIGLDASETDAQGIGVSLPGVPGIVAGHNAWIAWAATGVVGTEVGRSVDDLLRLLGARSLASVDPADRALDGCAAELAGGVEHLGPLRFEGGVILGAGRGGLGERLGAIGPADRIDVEALRVLLGRPSPSDAAARIVVDLGDVDASKAAISVGQSAHRASPHYRDQVPLWEAGQLHRLAWSRRAVARVDGQLVLRPR